MATLFESVQLGSLVLANRVFMAPLTRNRADADGVPGELAATYYAQRASAGLIVTEATQISPMGKGYFNTPGIHSLEQVRAWSRIVESVHKSGGRIFLQLWHVGRISHSSLLPNNAQPVAPSAIRANSQTLIATGLAQVSEPVALTASGIKETLDDYRRAAGNAKAAGFDGVEIHAANGYLIDQFLKTGSNQRTDEYGGVASNRVRFLNEAVEKVLDVWDGRHVGVRISPTVSFNDMADDDPRETFSVAVDRDDQIRLVAVDVERPKGKKLHFVEPTLVEARHLENGLGYLKIAMFPGMVGVEVANEITRAVEKLGEMDSVIIDLRGNTGGGIGALRVMSLLTSGKIPVGFALDRKRVTPNLDTEKPRFRRFKAIPNSKKALWPLALKFAPAMLAKTPIVLETEGLGRKVFHGKVILLVDRHTASAAEMIVAFARENNLARIVGENTAGRLLSATSAKVGQGFRLALPTGAYYTWKRTVLEGTPIEPDELIEFDWQSARRNKDRQLEYAIESVSAGQSH